MAPNNNSTSQTNEPTDVWCAGKSKKEWGKIALFYLTFHSLLVVFFAICCSVMFATLPERHEGPKTSFILNPGVSFTPREIDDSGYRNPDIALPRRASATPASPFSTAAGLVEISL